MSHMKHLFWLFLLQFFFFEVSYCDGEDQEITPEEQDRRFKSLIINKVKKILNKRIKEKIQNISNDNNVIRNSVKIVDSKTKDFVATKVNKFNDTLIQEIYTVLDNTAGKWRNKMEVKVVEHRKIMAAKEKNLKQTLEDSVRKWSDDTKRSISETFSELNQTIAVTLNQTEANISGLSFDNGKPAFSATMSRNGRSLKVGIVNFSRPITECCGNGFGYSPETGVFTAEKEGLYLLSCSFLIARGYTNLQLLQNGRRLVGRSYSSGDSFERTGLLTRLIFLKRGDKVSVERIPGYNTGVIRGDLYSTFSGFML